MRLKVEILESEWKELKELNPSPNTPYWFKVKNGNVVLAIHITTDYCSGWAKVSFDNDMNLVYNESNYYLLKGAMVQEAIIN